MMSFLGGKWGVTVKLSLLRLFLRRREVGCDCQAEPAEAVLEKVWLLCEWPEDVTLLNCILEITMLVSDTRQECLADMVIRARPSALLLTMRMSTSDKGKKSAT